ncbi:fungal-specific transcription factor domain-containing protein [Xylariales sp. PMI_506]|nr:fungal-specific transcription factor domain-containing protein [Xylariales sp. PMI_506]
MPPDSGQASHQQPKRRKVAESCILCRAKKTRCDGQRPFCTPCRTKGLACEYSDLTVPVSVNALSAIETRLRRLEEQATATPGSSAINYIAAPRSTGNGIQTSTPARSFGSWPRHDVSGHESGGQGVESTRVVPDYPMAQFIKDIAEIAHDQAAGHRQSHSYLWGNSDGWPVETDTSAMVVPKRAVADDLLHCYETYAYPIFPILHRPSFRRNYEQLWEPNRRGQFENLAAESIFYATLNIVFALGCLNHSQVEASLKLRTADTFYRRTRALLPLDAIDFPSLGAVHCLLITTQYLSYTKYSNRCYNTIAVAIRVAQTLGLHLDTEASASSQLNREMSRRTWHNCLTLERLFSSLFGRKAMIDASNNIPLPAKIDDEYLVDEGAGVQPEGVPSLMDAFIVAIKTYEITEGVRKVSYSANSPALRLTELTHVLQLNEKLDQIENELPLHLKYPKHHEHASQLTPRDAAFSLQSVIIMTRIKLVRLLLLRPSVLVAARLALTGPAPASAVPPPTRTEITLGKEASTLCVQAATSAIDLLHTNLRSAPASRLFSASAVFVTLSAATVVVAATLVPELNVSIERSEESTREAASGGAAGGICYKDVMTKALEILDEHRWQVDDASAARDQLKSFIETVDHARRQRDNVNFAISTSLSSEGAQQSQFGVDLPLVDFDFSDPLWDIDFGSLNNMFWNTTAPILT